MNTRLDQAGRVVERYIQARRWGGYATATLTLYRHYQNDFLKYLKSAERIDDLKGVNEDVILRYQEHLANGLKNGNIRTRSMRLMAIQDLFMWLARRGVPFPGSIAAVELPERRPSRCQELLTKDDFRKIYDAVKPDGERSLRDRAILQILCGNALRCNEVCNIRLDDFKNGNTAILIRSEKEKDRRVISLNDETYYHVKEYLDHGRAKFPNADKLPWLFMRFEGVKMKHWHIALVVQRYARWAGFKRYVSGHMIRNSVASHLAASKGGKR